MWITLQIRTVVVKLPSALAGRWAEPTFRGGLDWQMGRVGFWSRNGTSLMRGKSGVHTYKTKGTVLVFSWCGSGSIMPCKDQERERQKEGKALAFVSYLRNLLKRFVSTGVKGSTLRLCQKAQTQQRLRNLERCSMKISVCFFYISMSHTNASNLFN